MHAVTAGPPADSLIVRKKGFAWVAWIVIILLVATIFGLQIFRSSRKAEAGEDRAALVLMRIQAQYMVGAAEMPGQSKELLYAQAKPLNTGPVSQRLRFVVVAGELSGPAEALAVCKQLREKMAEQSLKRAAPFTWDNSIDAMLRGYKKAIAN